MKNSDMLLLAVSSGDGSDDTISAALDALREDAKCDLIGAVQAVARAWRAGVDARDIHRATQAIAEGSPTRTQVLSRIAEYAWPHFATEMTVLVLEGDSPPSYMEPETAPGENHFGPMAFVVGARWVITVLEEDVPVARNGRPRRSRTM